MKEAWQETLEESGVNLFPNGSSTLAQLAVEQDFATGGQDRISTAGKEILFSIIREA